ncbi:MAG: Holliday junction branch migration DNA helicase RuvB [Abditibacteriota bacterium]|nr:Holliday junction branch migration DNA helicase RuvB [Abditibacteriota bacterium]
MAIEKNEYTERFVAPARLPEDQDAEFSLRPRRFSELIGRDKIAGNLRIYIQAAKNRNEALDHVLLYGPPGLGKTTLAYIIANEMEVPIKSTSGPAIEKQGDLVAVLTNLEPNSVLFIDEIHRLNRSVEEMLYPAMEDFKLDFVVGSGPSARTIKVDIKPFTLVGATTRAGMITNPLRTRFGIVHNFDFYDTESLALIVQRTAGLFETEITRDGALEIASRSRGTPRIANRILKRVRDYAEVKCGGKIDLQTAREGLAMLEIDEAGLDSADRRLLLTIIEKYQGGPVGLDTLSAAIGEEKDTIEDAHEPYLIQKGFINRTARGRMATPLAYEHMGIEIKTPETGFAENGLLSFRTGE